MTLDELNALCDATTPGPWHHDSYGTVFSGPLTRAYNAAEALLPDDAPESAYDGLPDPTVCSVRRRAGEPADPTAAADAAFIAAVKTAVPLLIERIRQLEAVLRDVAVNYDHEECYHRNGVADTHCRTCKAEAILSREGAT